MCTFFLNVVKYSYFLCKIGKCPKSSANDLRRTQVSIDFAVAVSIDLFTNISGNVQQADMLSVLDWLDFYIS